MKKTILTILAAVAVCMTTAAQGINFAEGKSFAEVKAQAKAEGKLIFVDCYTSWCGPCKMMATKEFVKKEAGDYFNDKFVNFKIDMEKGEGPELGKQYDVSAYPTFLILESDGQLRGRCVGAAQITEFIKRVEGVLSNEKGLTWYQKKFAEGERGESFLMDYVKLLNENYMRGELKNVAATLLSGKSGQQIASDKGLYSAFAQGGFSPDDEVFLAVYKQLPTVKATQGEKAVTALNATWSQYALRCMQFDGKQYKGFDEAAFNAYKQKMADYGVSNIDDIVKSTLRSKARYAKDYPAILQGIADDMKGGEKIEDYTIANDMQTLVSEYGTNKKAMKSVAKYARQRVAALQKVDTSKEREFEYEGKKYTMTAYLISLYQDIIDKTSKK